MTLGLTVGSFNVETVIAALIVVSQVASIGIAELVTSLVNIRGLYGRMDGVDFGQNFL